MKVPTAPAGPGAASQGWVADKQHQGIAGTTKYRRTTGLSTNKKQHQQQSGQQSTDNSLDQTAG
jgi:hypothetical protein